MRISRSTAGTAFVGGALILTLTALAYPSMLGVQNTASGQDRIIANTQYGPLTEADRDFVVKVRAAGLWESPLGALVIQRGGSAAMKEAGEAPDAPRCIEVVDEAGTEVLYLPFWASYVTDLGMGRPHDSSSHQTYH